MAIAMTLQDYLDEMGVDYSVCTHAPTGSTSQTAMVANIPGEKLAKSVMLEDDDGHYRLAVVPSNRLVDLEKLHIRYSTTITLTPEEKLGELFDDCVLGAIPAVGNAYGFDVVWDDTLAECDDVYFEAGDHMHLIHISGSGFQRLMANADRYGFSVTG